MTERKPLGLQRVRALKPGDIEWDTEVSGFGARRQPGNAVAYVLKYRTVDGRQRWLTIGRHGAQWTPDLARKEARRLLAEVAKGNDPASDKIAKRRAATVAELCDLYWTDASTGRLMTRLRTAKKISTLRSDYGRLERHIKPLLGRMKVAAVTREDVERFMYAVADGKTAARAKTPKVRGMPNVRGGMGTASRTVGLLGAIFSYAVRHRMRSDNPVHGVIRPADGKRERRLSDAEYRTLNVALQQATGGVWPPAVAATWFLALTGWRSGEALGLRWHDVDLVRRTVILLETKTGRSIRPLAQAAREILRVLGPGADAALVFPPTRGAGTMTGFRKLWDRIVKLTDLPADVTPHVLRHSFISLAADLGYSESTIASLVGHKGQTTTSRYIHSADSVLLAAADAVAWETLSRMGTVTNPEASDEPTFDQISARLVSLAASRVRVNDDHLRTP
jgi:integrase